MKLKEVSLFSEFTEKQIDKVKKITVPTNYATRETVIDYNDKSNEFYILEEGKVQVEVPVDEGKNIISILRPVAIFGEVGLLDNAHRSIDWPYSYNRNQLFLKENKKDFFNDMKFFMYIDS